MKVNENELSRGPPLTYSRSPGLETLLWSMFGGGVVLSDQRKEDGCGCDACSSALIVWIIFHAGLNCHSLSLLKLSYIRFIFPDECAWLSPLSSKNPVG
jgi:hypothetical protein